MAIAAKYYKPLLIARQKAQRFLKNPTAENNQQWLDAQRKLKTLMPNTPEFDCPRRAAKVDPLGMEVLEIARRNNATML